MRVNISVAGVKKNECENTAVLLFIDAAVVGPIADTSINNWHVNVLQNVRHTSLPLFATNKKLLMSLF